MMAPPSLRGQPLAPRERQILRLYVEHESVNLIAEVLGLSPQTIKNNLHNAYRKLDVTNNLGAMKALGWLRVPSGVGSEAQP